MVIFLALYPIIVVAGIFALDIPLPIELVAVTASSPIIIAVLSVCTLAAVLVAANRHRENGVLMGGWLLLFCGLLILTLGSLMDPYVSTGDAWIEEIFSTAAFFPLLFFAVLIASPVRLVMLTRRQRTLNRVVSIIVIFAIFAVVFFPWLLLYQGPRHHGTTRHLLALIRPVLDALLTAPLALLVIVIGMRRGSGPYLLLGIGLLLFIPEDIIEHFQLLREAQLHGMVSDLISIASRLYLLNGAILGVFSREGGLHERDGEAALPS
jgi:hypothetical protein